MIDEQDQQLNDSGYYGSPAHDQALIEEHEARRDGELQLLDVLEDQSMANSLPVAPPPPPSVVAPVLVGLTTQKRHHSDLLLEGVCQRCAHCGMELTDSVSVERGIGPTCSKKGYLEDPKDGDEMQAMIDLAEYPELVQFLTDHYKPQGVRGLMNGLVKVASLNRKHAVFSVCCDAIDSLGYRKLASILRESLAAVLVSENKQYPDYLVVWVKRANFQWSWYRLLKVIPGVRHKTYGVRGVLVPKVQRRALWAAILSEYKGLVVKTPKGAFKVARGSKQPVQM